MTQAQGARDTWDPRQYDRFQSERSQPFYDLLEMTIGLLEGRRPDRVVDLGCGTGELTATLHERTGARQTLGLDNSANMLAKAAPGADGALRFEQAEITEFAARPAEQWDVIFSNAALQWVPDHPNLLGRLAGMLRKNGVLAVQVPANHADITHTAARALSRREPYAAALGGWERESFLLEPEAYATMLYRLGFARQTVRLVVYPHVLDDREQVLQWQLGTLLTDYRRRLPESLWPKFLGDYRQAIFSQIADQRPIFFPFKRMLFCAAK